MPTSKSVQFPMVKALFEEIMSRPWPKLEGKGNEEVTNHSLAVDLDLPPAYVSYFRNGLKAPNSSQIAKLARRLHGSANSQEKESFIQRLADAAKVRVEASGDFLRDLANGTVSLKASSVAYRPFSGDRTCAFEKLADRFLDMCGIKRETTANRWLLEPSSLSTRHFLLSVYDSPDRMLHLKFWKTPIRMSLGGVIHSDHRNRVNDVATALSIPRDRHAAKIRPIVLRDSMGAAAHCQRRLKFKDDDMSWVECGPNSADRLADELVKVTKARPAAIPVVCTDEYMAIEVLNSKKLCGEGISVFDIISQAAIREPGVQRELPQYYLSFAIKRDRQDRFTEYMQDAFTHFLLTEPETTANVWHELARKLLDDLCNLQQFPLREQPQDHADRWRHAWNWVKYTLHLDRSSIDSYANGSTLPWRAVLVRARELMHQYFLSDRQLLDTQARFSLEQRVRKGRSSLSMEVRSLFELFDLDVPENFSTAKINDADDISRLIHLSLSGRLRAKEFNVRSLDGLEISNVELSDTRGFLRELQAQYERAGALDVVERIGAEIDNLKREYSSKHGRIIFATSFEGGKDVSIGAVLLKVVSKERSELRFLWVSPEYRSAGVGRRLVEHGISAAASLGSKSIGVEILPSNHEAIDLFSKRGFSIDDHHPRSVGDRKVLKLQL